MYNVMNSVNDLFHYTDLSVTLDVKDLQ